MQNQTSQALSPKAEGFLKNTEHKPHEKAKLAETLSVLFTLQKQYGRTAKDLEMLVEGYCMVLSHRSMGEIIGAIHKYCATHADIPAPADIENIINPPPPKIDWALYVSLKQKLRDNIFVTESEKQFLRKCETIGVARLNGEADNYQAAQAKLEASKSYSLEDFS